MINDNPRDVIDPMYTADERNDIIDGTRFVSAENDNRQISSEISTTDNDYFRDKLGRGHYKTFMSGQTKLVLRAVKSFPSNSMLHVNDMLPLLKSDVQRGVGVAFIKVDNGGGGGLESPEPR